MLGCGVFVFMPKSLAQGIFASGVFRREKENVIEAKEAHLALDTIDDTNLL